MSVEYKSSKLIVVATSVTTIVGLSMLSVAVLFLTPAGLKIREWSNEGKQAGKKVGMPDTPIKVRGGSMTFYLKSTPWIPDPTHPRKVLCANVDPDLVSFEGFAGAGGGPFDGSQPQPWTIAIHDGSSTDPIGNQSITLKSSSLGCPTPGSPSPMGKSVRIELTADPDTDPDVSHNRNKRFYRGFGGQPNIRRFRRRAAACLQTQGVDPDDPGGLAQQEKDIDTCERMTSIELKTSGMHDPVSYDCPDLDCAIFIGPH